MKRSGVCPDDPEEAERDEALRQMLRRARRQWNEIIDLVIAKDRLHLRGADTSDHDRILATRGSELAQTEAAIARLEPARPRTKARRRRTEQAELVL